MDSRIQLIAPHKSVPSKWKGEEGDKLLPFAKLDAFRVRHHLSVRDLASICGGAANGVTKSTIHRMLLGSVTEETVDRIKHKIAEGLRKYLVENEFKPNQIKRELEGILEREEIGPFSLSPNDAAALGAWPQKLEAFRVHYMVSYTRLVEVCGGPDNGVCRSTLQRLSGGPAREPRSNRRIKPLIIEGLRRFLSAKGRSAEQIQAELSNIFPLEEVAMIAPRTTLPPEAQKHFGLKRDPFTSDPRARAEVFTTPQLDKILAQVEDAINYQGFVGVAGEIGSGKTVLKRRVMEMAEQSNGRIRLLWPEFFNMDRVHSGSIVSYLLRSFDQVVPADLVARAEKLKHILNDASQSGIRVALGFDECHHLHDRLLTALKNFWEMGTGGYTRFIGVVLFGQPQFEGRLRDHRFREICERIDILRMPPLGKAAGDYLAHRIRVAGGDIDRLFERDAVRLLTKQASTPLAIGNLANASLLKAYQLGEKKVFASFIQKSDSEPAVLGVRR